MLSLGLHGHTDAFGLTFMQLTPPTIGPNETVIQAYTAPLAEVGDFVVVTLLAHFTGTCIVGSYISSPGIVEVTWLNTDNQTATPPASPGLLFFLRQQGGVPVSQPQGVALIPSH